MKRFATAAFAALMLASAAPALAQETTTEEAPASQVFINPYAVMRFANALAAEMNRSQSLEVSCTRLQRDNVRWQRNAHGQMMINGAYVALNPQLAANQIQQDMGRIINHRAAVQACEKLFPEQPIY